MTLLVEHSVNVGSRTEQVALVSSSDASGDFLSSKGDLRNEVARCLSQFEKDFKNGAVFFLHLPQDLVPAAFHLFRNWGRNDVGQPHLIGFDRENNPIEGQDLYRNRGEEGEEVVATFVERAVRFDEIIRVYSPHAARELLYDLLPQATVDMAVGQNAADKTRRAEELWNFSLQWDHGLKPPTEKVEMHSVEVKLSSPVNSHPLGKAVRTVDPLFIDHSKDAPVPWAA